MDDVNDKLLGIYLNDHLAGAEIGVEVAKRSLSKNTGTSYGTFLAELLPQIEEDRATLARLMDALGISQDKLKHGAAWAAEKIGRLKLNGQLTGYSPLSRLVEFEGLKLGVAGKLSLWRSLKEIAGHDSRLAIEDFDELIRRAETQLDGLEKHRLAAATDALT